MREMTPRAIANYVETVNEHHIEEYRERVALAHLTASLSRIPATKEGNRAFPTLQKLLKEVAPKRKRKASPEKRRSDMISYFNSLPGTKNPLRVVKNGKVKK